MGCADAEPILNNDYEEPSEIADLYRLWKENPRWGAIKWLCLKRNQQPQKPIKDKMIKDNYWDNSLEKLPPNYYWTKLQENNNKKKEKFLNLSPEEKNIIILAAKGELKGQLKNYPLFLKAMNEGIGFSLKEESFFEESPYIQSWAKLVSS